MKGFGSRERNGLIVFCCIVVFFMAIGPLVDRLGCTAVRECESASVVPVGSELITDSALSDDSTDSEPVKTSKERKERKDTVKRKKRTTRRVAPKSSPDPQRRNYLDEPL